MFSQSQVSGSVSYDDFGFNIDNTQENQNIFNAFFSQNSNPNQANEQKNLSIIPEESNNQNISQMNFEISQKSNDIPKILNNSKKSESVMTFQNQKIQNDSVVASQNPEFKTSPNLIQQNSNSDKKNIFQNYKKKLSQQIDCVEKIASQQVIQNDENPEMPRIMDYVNNAMQNDQSDIEFAAFYQTMKEKLYESLNKKLDIIEELKSKINQNLNKYKNSMKTKCEKLIDDLLKYSEDVHLNEKKKKAIGYLLDQFSNMFNLVFTAINKIGNEEN